MLIGLEYSVTFHILMTYNYTSCLLKYFWIISPYSIQYRTWRMRFYGGIILFKINVFKCFRIGFIIHAEYAVLIKPSFCPIVFGHPICQAFIGHIIKNYAYCCNSTYDTPSLFEFMIFDVIVNGKLFGVFNRVYIIYGI